MGLGQAVGQPIAAGITTAGSVATTAMTNQANKKIADKTNATSIQIARENNQNQERLQDKQNQWNLEQWERENEYNSPQAQMERYAAAGINPVWAMSGGSVSNGNASQLESAGVGAMSMPTLGMPTMEAPDIATGLSSMLNAFSNWTKTKADVKKTDADRANVEAQTAAIVQKTPIEIANLMKTGSLMDEQTKLTIEQCESEDEKQKLMAIQTDATREAIVKTKAETSSILSNIIVSLGQLKVAQQNADIAGYNAVTNRITANTGVRAQNLAEKKYRETEYPMFIVDKNLKEGMIILQDLDEQLKRKDINGVQMGMFGTWNLDNFETQLEKLNRIVKIIPENPKNEFFELQYNGKNSIMGKAGTFLEGLFNTIQAYSNYIRGNAFDPSIVAGMEGYDIIKDGDNYGE